MRLIFSSVLFWLVSFCWFVFSGKNWISSTLIHRMITYFSQLLCCDSVDDYFDTSLASNSMTDIYSYVLYIKACLDNFLSPSLLTYSHFAWFTVSFYDVHITHFQTELKRIFSRFFLNIDIGEFPNNKPGTYLYALSSFIQGEKIRILQIFFCSMQWIFFLCMLLKNFYICLIFPLNSIFVFTISRLYLFW